MGQRPRFLGGKADSEIDGTDREPKNELRRFGAKIPFFLDDVWWDGVMDRSKGFCRSLLVVGVLGLVTLASMGVKHQRRVDSNYWQNVHETFRNRFEYSSDFRKEVANHMELCKKGSLFYYNPSYSNFDEVVEYMAHNFDL